MTHLNNFYYLQICMTLLVFFIWSLIRIYRTRGYRDIFNWKNIRTFQMKTTSTWLLFISWGLHFIYAAILSKVKYAEGYTVIPDGSVIYTPRTMYTSANERLATACDSILDVVMASKTSSIFMMVAGFHHIFGESNIGTFVSSWEFHLFRCYSILSVIAYPVLQTVYKNDDVRTTVTPQLWYCGENLFAIIMLCIIAHRMYRYVYITQSDKKQSATSRTIQHLMFSLIQLICLLLVDFISFTTINIDALTPQQSINKDKFWLDLSSLFLNMSVTLACPAMICVLYPFMQSTTHSRMRDMGGGMGVTAAGGPIHKSQPRKSGSLPSQHPPMNLTHDIHVHDRISTCICSTIPAPHCREHIHGRQATFSTYASLHHHHGADVSDSSVTTHRVDIQDTPITKTDRIDQETAASTTTNTPLARHTHLRVISPHHFQYTEMDMDGDVDVAVDVDGDVPSPSRGAMRIHMTHEQEQEQDLESVQEMSSHQHLHELETDTATPTPAPSITQTALTYELQSIPTSMTDP